MKHSFPMQGMTMKPLSCAARAWQFDAVSAVGDGTAWLSGLLSKAKARRLLCQLVVTMISRIVWGFARIFLPQMILWIVLWVLSNVLCM